MLETIIGLLPIPPGFNLVYASSFLLCVPTPTGMERMPYDVIPPFPAMERFQNGVEVLDQSAGSPVLGKGMAVSV